MRYGRPSAGRFGMQAVCRRLAKRLRTVGMMFASRMQTACKRLVQGWPMFCIRPSCFLLAVCHVGICNHLHVWSYCTYNTNVRLANGLQDVGVCNHMQLCHVGICNHLHVVTIVRTLGHTMGRPYAYRMHIVCQGSLERLLAVGYAKASLGIRYA